MHVEWQLGAFTQRRQDGRTETDVRNEMTVHDVKVEPVGSPLFRKADLLLEAAEIGGEDGRRE